MRTPSRPKNQFDFGGFSPTFSLFKRSTGLDSRKCAIEFNKRSKKIAEKTSTVFNMAMPEMEKVYTISP